MEAQRIVQIEGTAILLRGDDIDTDRIMPARFLKVITFDGLERHLFEDDRKSAAAAGSPHPFDAPRYQGASVLLVNTNFGCGSSREHAPQGLYRWGIRAVVGESFSDIFFGNASIIGLPCVTAASADVRQLMDRIERDPTVKVTVDLAAGTCRCEGFQCRVAVPAPVRDAFVTGTWDTTGLLLERYEQVNDVAGRLPYVNGFSSLPPR
jgi:3-isopropylmalate/(R)-2-methylmalate dehydratase small subunit